MRNNKHTIFNNKQLAKRQIGIKQNIEMTKKKRSKYIYGKYRISEWKDICLYICTYMAHLAPSEFYRWGNQPRDI